MKLITAKSYEELSRLAANIISEQVRTKPTSVLGFATGSSPVGTYKNLVKMYKDGKMDFSRVTTFNLDEYCGLNKKHSQSYYYFMMENLFSHINVPKENINLPNGTAKDFAKECESYERKIEKAGGIDLQILGVGANGHIGFNEPDEVFHNKTMQVKLADSTIKANARFFEKADDVPKTALSMGIGTIMAAKKIVLVAGADKLHVIKELSKPVVSPKNPVSILHYHPDCTIIYVKE